MLTDATKAPVLVTVGSVKDVPLSPLEWDDYGEWDRQAQAARAGRPVGGAPEGPRRSAPRPPVRGSIPQLRREKGSVGRGHLGMKGTAKHVMDQGDHTTFDAAWLPTPRSPPSSQAWVRD